jgi:transcriptional regulator with XRE-family HTH domain
VCIACDTLLGVVRIRPHLGNLTEDDALYVQPARRMSTLASALVVQARQRSGLTQAELAHRAGTSRTALSAIEHGKRDPGLERLQEILLAAGFDLLTSLAEHDDHDDVLKEQGDQLSPEAREERSAAMQAFYDEARAAMKDSAPHLQR